MKIGIDARLYYETGVGRYIRNLIQHLQRVDTKNHYVVFLGDKGYDAVSLQSKNWEKRRVSIGWHSFSEQISFIPVLLKEKLDLVHFPYFSFPVLYPGRFIVTIHDLIISHFDTGQATTLPLAAYKLKRVGYQLALNIGLRRAHHIIAVSNATKSEIIDHVGINLSKISVVYEGIDEKIKNLKLRIKNKKALAEKPYFLYVGNAYPHKNVDGLIDAFSQYLQNKKEKDVQLVLVGKMDYFYQQLEKRVKKQKMHKNIAFFGKANDTQLANLYQNASALVAPSFMEGFGLTVLEALSYGCLVLASDIVVFRELFDDTIQYFDPHKSSELARLMDDTINQAENWSKKREKAQEHAMMFDWEKAAEKTLKIYENCTSL